MWCFFRQLSMFPFFLPQQNDSKQPSAAHISLHSYMSSATLWQWQSKRRSRLPGCLLMLQGGCFKRCAACRNMIQFAVLGQDLLDERDCPWHFAFCFFLLESCRIGFHLPCRFVFKMACNRLRRQT